MIATFAHLYNSARNLLIQSLVRYESLPIRGFTSVEIMEKGDPLG